MDLPHPLRRSASRVRRAATAGLLCLVLVGGLPGRTFAGTEEVLVEMSDGVGLFTRVILSDAGGGPWPVLLVRTPYTEFGSVQSLIDDALDLVTLLGFGVVLQDTRGFGGSEGENLPFRHDRSDGQETIAWILAQPWCDGRVTMLGASAVGIPDYLAAPDAPPDLVCLAVAIATPTVFRAAYHGGVLKKADTEAWTRWVGAPAGIVDEIRAHRDCDEYWEPVRVAHMGPRVRAAALHLGGWWDMFSHGTIEAFHMFRASEDPWAAAHQYLIMGPWEHNGFGEAQVGHLTFPANAAFDFVAAALAWGQWCIGFASPMVEGWPTVQYYVMGDVDDPEAPGNEWREADDWPPFPLEERPLHFAADGTLSWQAPEEELAHDFPFDPADPSPTTGGRNLSIGAGPRDQARVEERGDALVFTTAELEEPFEATGPYGARLWVSTTALDGDFAVRLTDVYPDGRSMLVADGIVRLSRREGCAAPVPVAPGEVMEILVDLAPKSYIFHTGHRIRAIVTGSNHPRYEVNPFLFGPEEEPHPITLRLVTGGERPSALLLPVPAPELPVVEGAEIVEDLATEAVEPPPFADVVEPPPADVPLPIEVIDAGPTELPCPACDTAPPGRDTGPRPHVDAPPGFDRAAASELPTDTATAPDKGPTAPARSSSGCHASTRPPPPGAWLPALVLFVMVLGRRGSRGWRRRRRRSGA